MAFSFLHAADLHLDSPLRGLAVKDAALASLFQRASRRALDNLVAAALDGPVNFVVIAGDVFDGDWKNYETGLLFDRAMARLARAGVRVFAVRGNHDAESVITRRISASSVRFFDSKPESIELDDLGVVLHGHSFAKRACAENIAVRYPAPRPGRFNIGLLHTSLAGTDGHEPYAPCEIKELAAKGYAYWALGHVHKAARVATDPWIVYPGNLQGRHARELGAKGAVRVTVRDDRVAEVESLVLDAARFEQVELRLDGCEELADVARVFRERAGGVVADAGGRPVALRVSLRGETGLHGLLLHDRERVRAEFTAAAALLADQVLIEKVVVATAPSGGASLPSGLPDGFYEALRLEAQNPELAARLAQELQEFKGKLPADLFADPDLRPFDPDQASALLAEVVSGALAMAERSEP